MKRLLAAVALLGGCLVFGTSQADTGTPASVDHRSGYMHLLLLDQREAMEHVKALHEYADHHGDAMDPLILCRHVDDLGRNIQGMQDDLAMIEKAPGTPVASWTKKIRGQQVDAAKTYAALKAQCEESTVRPERVKSLAFDLYLRLRPMSKQDHRMMMRMAVLEPMSPVRFP
jgi:hypothetical protein